MSRLPESIACGSDLATVADAIGRASAINGPVYVERRGTLYRWSLTHRGGPYPLLRETAKLLGLDHHTLVLPFRAVEGHRPDRHRRRTSARTARRLGVARLPAGLRSRVGSRTNASCPQPLTFTRAYVGARPPRFDSVESLRGATAWWVPDRPGGWIGRLRVAQPSSR